MYNIFMITSQPEVKAGRKRWRVMEGAGESLAEPFKVRFWYIHKFAYRVNYYLI